MHWGSDHAVNLIVFELLQVFASCQDKASNIAKHLPEDCAKTESACHDTPQQAASSNHPDPIEVVPCMADDMQ